MQRGSITGPLMHARHFLDMLPIMQLIVSLDVLRYSSCKARPSSCKFLQCWVLLCTRGPKTSQMCSIGEISGRVRTGLKSTWIYRTVLKNPWKLNLPWKVLEKHSKALKSPWILPFTEGFNTVFGDPNQYKLVCFYLVQHMLHQIKAPQFYTNFLKLLIILRNAVRHFQSRLLTCKSVFFISFQSLKAVGKSLRSPWKVLEFYSYLPVSARELGWPWQCPSTLLSQ